MDLYRRVRLSGEIFANARVRARNNKYAIHVKRDRRSRKYTSDAIFVGARAFDGAADGRCNLCATTR